LGRGERPRARHRLVEAELVADHYQGGVHGRTHLAHRLAHERLELPFVDRHLAPHAFQTICWISVYSSIPKRPPSRPMPLSLKPPKGASRKLMPLLIHTTPVRMRLASSIPLAVSRVSTMPPRPSVESFAMRLASSSPVNGIT